MSKKIHKSDSSNKKKEKNRELISKTEIPNTPFTVVNIDNEFYGVMGKYRLTEGVETEQKCIELVSEISWNRLIQVILILKEEDKL
jgi:hypothetical protein